MLDRQIYVTRHLGHDGSDLLRVRAQGLEQRCGQCVENMCDEFVVRALASPRQHLQKHCLRGVDVANITSHYRRASDAALEKNAGYPSYVYGGSVLAISLGLEAQW